jgi:hypothetical protein
MSDKKQKEIIVSNVRVKGYVKHVNGRKTMFDFSKHDFEPKSLEKIFEELGRKYE